jgi:hypothetical protein
MDGTPLTRERMMCAQMKIIMIGDIIRKMITSFIVGTVPK